MITGHDLDVQQSLNELVELFSDIVLLVEPNSGRILGCNSAAESRYGYARAELCSLSIARLRTESQRNSVHEQLQLAESTGLRFETVHQPKHGEPFPVEVNSRGTTVGEKRILVSVVRDISERIRAEATLRESERVFARVFHCSPGFFAISTISEERIVDVNDSFLHCFERCREEVIGHTFNEFGIWLDPHLLSRLADHTTTHGSVSCFESAFRRPGGELGYGLISATRIEVRGVSCLLTETVDITDRKHSEEQLRLVKTSIDRAPHAAYWMDPQGKIIYVNESGCKALGYTHDEMLELHVSAVNPKATPQRWQQVYQAIKDQGSITIQSVHRRKDGTLIDVELTSSYFRSGEREYCLGFAVDITERIRSEHERELLQSQLNQAQKMESIGRLAGGVAHDFNNMLTIIQLGVQQGFEKIEPTHPLFEDLQAIDNAARRSAALTSQLLAFARKQTIAPKVLDLNGKISRMLDMMQRLVGENLRLEWRPDPQLWCVSMDPSQLDQLLANLCVNARDAINDVGTISIGTVNRTLEPEHQAPGRVPGDYVELTVRDDGCGMSEQVQAHLFEPFYTTKGDNKGIGLGLATVYGIVQQNRGFIEVVSAPNQGTTFKIYLPRAESKPESLLPSERVSAKCEKCTVLVVEDEPAILSLIRRQLSTHGYAVLTAQSPTEAIRVVKEHLSQVHLLLTDVIMPQLNGKDLAEAIAQISPGIRCLFMSGYTADIIAKHGVVDSEMAFIQKPFTTAQLIEQVARVLGRDLAQGERSTPNRLELLAPTEKTQ